MSSVTRSVRRVWRRFRELHWAVQLSLILGLVGVVPAMGFYSNAVAGTVRRGAAFSAAWQREFLTARDLPVTPGFKDRESELARLTQLWEEQPVIAVVGPPLCGKTWLIAKFLRHQRVQDKTIYIEMKEGRSGEALLKAVNAAMLDRGCEKLNATCRREKATLEQKTERLAKVLAEDGWVLALDSYERVEPESDIDKVVSSLSGRIGEGRVVLGTRARPKWISDDGVVTVGPMPREHMEAVWVELAGFSPKDLQIVYDRLAPLPGAVGVFKGLVNEKGEDYAVRLAREKPEEIGNRLFKGAFSAVPTEAQVVWMVVSCFPEPVSRPAAEAMCGEEVFADGVQVLEDWRIVTPGSEWLELHECARWAASGPLRWRWWTWWKWRKQWGRRAATYYGGLASRQVDQHAVRLDNVLAATQLARKYGEWEALWAMGYALDDPLDYAGRWTAREELLRLCADGAERTRNKEQRAAFTLNLGVALQNRGKLDEAEALYRESLLLRRALGNREWEAQTLHQLGRVAEIRGKLKDAEDLYNQSLAINRELGNRRGVAQNLHQLGSVAYLRGKLEEAKDLYRQSLGIEQEVGDRRGEAATLHQLGMVAQERGQLDDADDFYRQSLEMTREVGHRPQEAKTLHQLGKVAQDRGKLEEAEDLYRQSLEIEREVGDRPGEAVSYQALAMLAEKQGELGLAVERIEEAHRMFEEMGLPEGERAKGDLDRLRKRLEDEGGAGE